MIPGLKPTKKRVLAKRDDNSQINGLFIPEQYRDKNQFATVVEVGIEVDEISPGDRILTKKFYGEGIAIADDFFIIMEEDILGFIKLQGG